MVTLSVSSPGKVVISGEYAVLYGRYALVGSINKRLRLKITEDFNEFGNIHLKHNNYGPINASKLNLLPNTIIYCHDDLKEKYRKIYENMMKSDIYSNIDDFYSQIISAIVAICTQYISFGFFCDRSLWLDITNEFPFASGLGSSAAFSCCMATFVLFKLGEELGGQSIHKIFKTPLNKIAFEIEQIFHSNPSGMDNTCVCFGGLFLFKESKIVNNIKLSDDVNILIVDTGTTHATKKAIDKSTDETEQIFSSIDNNTVNLFQAMSQEMLADNHQQLKQLGVGFEEAEQVIEICRPYDIKMKITGSGCGGCLITLFHQDDLGKYITCIKSLEENGFHCILAKFDYKGTTIHQT